MATYPQTFCEKIDTRNTPFRAISPQNSRARKIGKMMGGKSAGDVMQQGASGTLFELWFFPRRTIVGRLVFVPYVPSLPHVSVYRTYVSTAVSNSTRSGYLYKPGRYGLEGISTKCRRHVVLLSISQKMILLMMFDKFGIEVISYKKF